MNTRLNKKVKKDLDAYFKGYRGSEPEVHHALKHILMGALTDANFHSESKRVANMFPKASKAKYYGRQEWEDSIEMNHGVPIAKAAKWDGYEIIDAISYWASMFIGGPIGAKITSLKEGMNENIRMFVNKFINEVTHSYEYEDMSTMSEDENDKEEFRIGSYHTKYFHLCPGASSLYMDIESKGVDMDMAERSARLHDVLFFVEEHIQRDGYKPEKDYIMVAKNLQRNIMKMAEMMGLEKEHHYIQGHVDIIIKTVEGKKLEEKVMNLTEKNVPTNPSKWSYYKSQAKKKFDVYPSAYANAWAAKQYKAAGGGWRKGKSESIEEGVMSNIHLMADASKDFEDFKKKFKKDYKKVFKNTPDFMDWLYGMYKDMAPLKAGEKVEEASRGEIHKAAKKGNYPATIVVSEKGKVVYQELVKTPQLVPAIFMILQKKYPNAKISVESKSGETLFTEAKEIKKKIKDIEDGDVVVLGRNKHFKVDYIEPWRAGGRILVGKDVKTGKKGKMKVKFLTPKGRSGTADDTILMVLKESVNEAMDKNKKFKVYDKLKKGDKIRIKFGSSIRRDNERVFVVTKGKTLVGKQKVERIILKNVENLKGVKYYLYNRDGNVSMAIGDMAAVIVDMIPESVNEAQKINSPSKKFLKGMKKIKVKGLGGYMPGVDYVYVDGDKYYFVDFEGDHMELKNTNTIKQLHKLHGSSLGESVNEYFVENYDDTKQLSEFLKENSVITEAEYQGRDVKLNKIMQGDVKKFKVYVKNPKGNVVKVNFGHKGKGGEKTMSIKKNNPEKRKSFRARHNCDNPGPKHKARYWSCRKW